MLNYSLQLYWLTKLAAFETPPPPQRSPVILPKLATGEYLLLNSHCYQQLSFVLIFPFWNNSSISNISNLTAVSTAVPPETYLNCAPLNLNNFSPPWILSVLQFDRSVRIPSSTIQNQFVFAFSRLFRITFLPFRSSLSEQTNITLIPPHLRNFYHFCLPFYNPTIALLTLLVD